MAVFPYVPFAAVHRSLMAHRVIRGDAPFLVATGCIADIDRAPIYSNETSSLFGALFVTRQ